MMESYTSCFKVSDQNLCPHCKENKVIKNGTTKNKKQQYFCKNCHKRFIHNYTYNAYQNYIDNYIVIFIKEGLGIRSTARVLKISTTTLLKRIILIARNIKKPSISLGKIYEVDELRTFIKRKNKLIWIVYALERETGKVVSLNIGNRSNRTLNVVLDTVKLSNPKMIFTDKLKQYQYLIEKSIHKTTRFGTNAIERRNLSLRTHLKRLNRKTICFSRNKSILLAVLQIYFWS
ncbi:IS1 family transposase [Flavobacterium sp. YO12]|uniref:IS1 family transposase n=1 Tax=Flavobacterium sp. YO12 TaxID=1920029 RepID=UPI00100A580F|nr:IS1 family transposase [Flavobacterium sp. YO12]RXM48288.1 transposase [Flavobacterium sp. YO12]